LGENNKTKNKKKEGGKNIEKVIQNPYKRIKKGDVQKNCRLKRKETSWVLGNFRENLGSGKERIL